MRPRNSKQAEGKATERRRNPTLREVLDDLLEHVRYISRNVSQMTATDLEYSQERLEWLADEVWRLATLRQDE